jgi:5-methylcytosine-specific restriction endonuclease McrA
MPYKSEIGCHKINFTEKYRLKTILTLLAIVFAFIFARYAYYGLGRFAQKFKDEEDFIGQHYIKLLASGAFLLYVYVRVGEGVSSFIVVLVMLASALAIYEYKSDLKEQQASKEYINEARMLREEMLKSGDGWTKQDVLKKFRTTLYYRRYGSLTTTTGWRCAACSKNLYQEKDAELDHILPRSKYPELVMSEKNLQILCRSCNAHKHAYDGDDWRKTIHKRRRAKNRKSK